MDIRLYPAALSGNIDAIVSKSDVHRALICAALSDAPTTLTFYRTDALGDDILATVGCLEALGASIRTESGAFHVTPCRPVGSATLDCHESGSTLRFLLPVAAACIDRFTVTGQGRLPDRPIQTMLDILSSHGCSVHGDRLPLTVAGTLQGGTVHLAGNISSQYVTGLLLAAPLLNAPLTIVLDTPLESAGYVDMTVRTMRAFGASVERTENGFTVQNGGYRTRGTYRLDGDWSGAAVFLAAKSMGHAITLRGLDRSSAQPYRGAEDLFGSVGGDAHIDVSNCPDLVPVLAVCAAFAEGETHIDNAARLRLKESDRLAAVAEGLTQLGAFVTEREDGLTVHGGGVQGGAVSAYGDHRMVMAWTLASLRSRGPIIIRGAEAVTKSYPTFFEDYLTLGGNYDVLTDR